MRRITFPLLALLMLSLKGNAISVVSDYLLNDTLEIISGSSKLYSIRLQNPTENEAGIKLEYDKTFMKVIDYKEVYNLPPKTTGFKILFNVTAPKKPGIYKVGYTVSEVEPAGSGGLPIRLKINRNFYLNVAQNPDDLNVKYPYLVYVVIALIFLLYAFKRKLTKKSSRHKP